MEEARVRFKKIMMGGKNATMDLGQIVTDTRFFYEDDMLGK